MKPFRPTAILIFVVISAATVTAGELQEAQPWDDSHRAAQIVQQIGTSDWLGPLAPIALSPYFGITCLAGLAQFGQGIGLEQNALVSQNPVLKNPAVFWIFLTLTLATSLPRLTKVSKPIAQLLDRLEMYSALITLVMIRLAVSEETVPVVLETQHAGLGSLSLDFLMILAAAANVIVISTVRFVCELIVWLSPIPFIDALFEIGNKSICTGLMALYAFSPFAATVVNLSLFAICAILFWPMYRRAIYMRSLIVDPVIATLFPKMGQLRNGEMIVFNRKRLGVFPAKSRLYLSKGTDGWMIRKPTWYLGSKSIELSHEVGPLCVQMGILVNRVVINQLDGQQLLFSRRYSSTIKQLVSQLGMKLESGQSNAAQVVMDISS